MSSKASELRTRTLSAAVLVPAALLLVWLGGVAFNIFITIVAGLMAIEWDNLIAAESVPEEEPSEGRKKSTGYMTALASILLVAFAGLSLDRFGQMPDLATMAGAIVIAMLASMIEQSVRRRPMPALRAFGILYIVVPCVALISLRADGQGEYWILWLFLVVWATDIGAYAFGRTFGGPKLAPSVSPNKTWSGAIGGLISAVLFSLPMVAVIDGLDILPDIALAAGLSAVSQAGDLFESGLKRRFGVKDSGSLIPGHGGLFDRLDGLLVAAPLALATQLYLTS